uniref:TraR/DksA family transcriptional regulator n=1 Tax=Streptomyces sp. NRRL S-118 TaxID=1463881 RepID=UPI003B63355C
EALTETAPGKKAPGKKAGAEKVAAVRVAGGTVTAEAGEGEAMAGAGRRAAKGEAPAEKAGGKKRAVKAAARKAAPAAEGAAQAAEKTGARTVAAKKIADVTPAQAAGAMKPVPQARGIAGAAPEELAVRPGEEPWSPEEVAEARAELEGEVARLQAELAASEEALSGLMRDSGDGAGHDEADTGTKNITREHEMALAANARATLEQIEHALQRLDAGTYGLCEVCGKPIGKARMQAFPRATLCVEDKQKQERRG